MFGLVKFWKPVHVLKKIVADPAVTVTSSRLADAPYHSLNDI